MYPTKNYVTSGSVIRNYVAALVCVFCCQVSFSQTNYLKLPASAPRTYNGQSNFVIENLSFTNMNGNNITIFNGNNITIRNCYFGVSQGIGVELENCSNITIENCFFANNKSGVYATSCSGIKVNNNQFINAQGPFPRGQFVQFNSVTGSGNSVSGNRGECFRGESYAEDLVNMYRSNGTSASPVLVKDNLFRGGGPSPSGGGLMSGDFDGGYVIVENNKLVFPGNYGIGIAGGNNIKLLNNSVYSERRPWTNVGIYVWAQQGASCSQITVEGNKSTWTHKDGFNNPFWDGGNCGPITWDGLNSSGQSLASMSFPEQLITCVTEDELWQVREQSREFVVTVQVNEMPPWLPRPTADAGEDKTVTTTTTTLSGSGGNTYRWVQVSGPNNATLTNASSGNVSLSGLVNGTYTFRLEAYDAEGAADADWVVLTVSNSQTVPNQAPAADAGNDISITLPTSTATLNGTGSSDADGTIASYQWTQVAGPNTATIGNATQASASLSGLIAGTYNFRLTVRDNDGATGTDEVTVIVNPAPVVNQAPVADAGNAITITLPTSTATLNGTGSSDADGTIASYQWTQVSGPNTATIGNATQASASLSGLVDGIYNFRLTVRDNDGATDTDEVTVTVNPAPVVNQAPVANAGNNIAITLPTSTATLNGSGSSDADGTIASYQWTQVSGPNTATIGNATQASASLSGLIAGTYNFRLTVRDNDGATDTDEATVIVNPAPVVNQAPVANAGNNITIILPTSTATLNGSGSSDADGTIASFQWTQVSGPNTATIGNATQASASLSGLIAGTYSFRLTVRDNDGATDTDEVTITVNAAPVVNQAPVANAGNNITITLPTSTATLDGSGSSDADGTIASYQWTQVSGPNTATIGNATQASASLSGLIAGSYNFRLTVRDNDGATDTDEVTVTVNPAPVVNQAPVANAGNNITITLPTSTATLNGSGSSDADGTIASYQWTQISGPNTATIGNATQASASLSGLIAGTYNFRLTVRDNDGATDTDEVTITVNPAPVVNQAPVANAGNNITITLPTSTATLNGTGSSDADGTIASYQWTQVSGPNTATIGNTTQASASLSGLIAGTYNFRLTVRDNDGATDTDDVTVTVNPAPVVNQAPVANAGNNITITLPTSTATLNGTGSSDADGTIASYQWTQLSGPNTATIGNTTQASASLSGLIAGTYNFRLTVRDNDGATDTDEVMVTVKPAPNQAPVANAGNNITITLPTSTATLNGTGSSDADGTIASYQWTQISGPNTAGITADNQASTSVTGLIEGVYSFQLSIRDNDGGVSSDLVTITVNPAPNKAPIANAGANIRITLPVNTANLNGSGSSDPDGTIASYQWSQLSGPTTITIANSTRATASVSGLVEGIYSFRLTIRDNDGASATANVSVTVSSAVNQLPIADAGSNITITLPANTSSLNGSGSSDPDGTIASYQWSQVSGPNTATMTNDDQAITALSNLTQGTYSFRLTVKDNKGATATETVSVIVNAAPNRSPVANAGNAVSITLPMNSVSANGSKSTDPDGTIVSYQWSQVSGPNTAVIANGNKSTATFSGLVKGIYSFRLIVKDDRGASSSATLSVTVNAAANLAPVANAGTSQVITLSTNEATLNGSLSKDPDGTIKSYQWQQLSGPVNAIISSGISSITTVTGFKEGDYVFQLIVRDNLNATAKDTVRIAVVNNFRSFAGGLMLYPNPATDKINFNYYSEEYNKAQINIYDVTGRKVMASIEVASSLNLFKTEINIGHLKPGVYLFEAIMNNKEKIGAKFLKQ